MESLDPSSDLSRRLRIARAEFELAYALGHVDEERAIRTFNAAAGISSDAPEGFVSANQQLKYLRRWNRTYALGISQEAFAALSSPPAWPNEPKHAVVLAWYLPGDADQTGFAKTLNAVLDIVPNATDIEIDEGFKKEAEFRLSERSVYPATNEPLLRWETIDLAAHWKKKDGAVPNQHLSERTPHLGILQAAIYFFPGWFERMRKEEGVNRFPDIVLPSIQIKCPSHPRQSCRVEGDDPWHGTFHVGLGGKKYKIGAIENLPNPINAIPELIEVNH